MVDKEDNWQKLQKGEETWGACIKGETFLPPCLRLSQLPTSLHLEATLRCILSSAQTITRLKA